MNIKEAFIKMLQDQILKAWTEQKRLQQVVEEIAQEIEEITEEGAQLDDPKEMDRYNAMLNAAAESNERAQAQLENVTFRHNQLRAEYQKATQG